MTQSLQERGGHNQPKSKLCIHLSGLLRCGILRPADLHCTIMKELLVLRHAKSDHGNAQLRDHDRPLNNRGRLAAPRMGRFLAEQSLAPDLILASTAQRTMDTTAGVADGGAFNAKVEFVQSLYLASPDAILNIVATRGGEANRVLLVGHNPGCEDVLSLLGVGIHGMPTCALAHVQLEIDDWSLLTGAIDAQLANLWCVKSLPET